MAEERNTQTTTVNDTQNQDVTVIEENLNLDAKVTVKNLAGWDSNGFGFQQRIPFRRATSMCHGGSKFPVILYG